MQRAKMCNFMFIKILHLTNIFISTFFLFFLPMKDLACQVAL